MSKKLNVLDLFCGAGGFSHGFEQAGYNIVAGVDNKQSALNTFEYNHDSTGIKKDLTDTHPSEIDDRIDENITVVIGGPPCKGFSVANNNTGHDDRNTLIDVFLDFVAYFEPKAVCMENVPAFRQKEYPTDEYESYENLVESRLNKLGYNVSIDVLNAVLYGVPQKRRRAIVLATKQNEQLEHPRPTHRISNNSDLSRTDTVEEAISGIDSDDASHNKPNHGDEMVERIANTSQGESLYDSYNSKIKLNPDEPSPTVACDGPRPSFRFAHPYENRGLTVRERARLQSFPDEFAFPVNRTKGRVLTGNAVPPLLAKSIAEEIADDIADDATDTSDNTD
jgi:DNA (cytosine-5)-methyltransferase 1